MGPTWQLGNLAPFLTGFSWSQVTGKHTEVAVQVTFEQDLQDSIWNMTHLTKRAEYKAHTDNGIFVLLQIPPILKTSKRLQDFCETGMTSDGARFVSKPHDICDILYLSGNLIKCNFRSKSEFFTTRSKFKLRSECPKIQFIGC